MAARNVNPIKALCGFYGSESLLTAVPGFRGFRPEIVGKFRNLPPLIIPEYAPMHAGPPTGYRRV